ncbi:hypothetical protein ACIREE_41040, partial [Streptomyces sp. NPDC102467]|uniref:hypothetical protein n=1 Tax=Streptomyces sp. NPDC102467 TaxID=3366179 RepID=UPI0038138016
MSGQTVEKSLVEFVPAGKENRESGNPGKRNEIPRKSDRKDLIESETQDSKTEGKRPEESPRECS